ncbi:hypothetical protein [Microbacterium plantarum]|uniref:Uncharacterized protein n=1 Tax=Microbacterium plantarum TaxID=1816425 RepID=A0ABV5EUE0_9MICO
MNMEQGTNNGAVVEARGHLDPDAQASTIKKAVAEQMLELDPGIKIQSTGYFNHSYIPDLVAVWREAGKKHERRVFIRGSMRSVLAADDLDALADQDPLVLGLAEENRKTWKSVKARIPKAGRILATDLSAATEMSRRPQKDGTDTTRLPDLVRSNIVRGGRGVLDQSAARRVVEVEDAGNPAAALERFEATVKRLFTGDTAARISRTAEALKEFFEASPSIDVLRKLHDDPLTDAELQVVLPFVLKRGDGIQDERVWRLLSSMLTLEALEAMSLSLSGLDLTKLIHEAGSTIRAARSAVFANADEEPDDAKDAREPSWKIKNGRLAADVHRWTLWVASDARKIKGRDDGPDARWDELAAPLRSFQMTGIELRGLSRQLSVENTQSQTVREDVENIRRTIDDDFHVGSVRLAEGQDEDAPTVRVDFAASTVTGQASLAFHVRAASLLAVKRPFTGADLNLLVD